MSDEQTVLGVLTDLTIENDSLRAENESLKAKLAETERKLRIAVEELEKINMNCHGDSVVYSRIALSQIKGEVNEEKHGL